MSSMRVLGGRYRLLNRLGGGDTSAVWRGYDQVLDRTVAVKLLGGDAAGAETRTAVQLSHPHICQVYDHGEGRTESGDHVTYIVMELLSGPNLEERLQAYPMPIRVALRICAQVASALAAAHSRGLVHRDLEPANVILSPAGPKIVDFGTPAIPQLLTPACLAPERLLESKASPASDVYALGLVLYRMVTGTAPWPAETVTQMLEAREYRPPAPLPTATGLPEPVTDLCQRCLAEDPRERPTAHEVARRLAEVVGWGVSRGGEQLIAPDDDVAPDATAAEAPPVPPEAAPASPTEAMAAIPDPGLPPPASGGDDPGGAPRPHVKRHHRRPPVLLAAAAVAATIAGVTGGIWMAYSPAGQHQSDAAGAPDSPATSPASIAPTLPEASPGGGSTGPTHTGRGEPRDAPDDSSSEPSSAEGQSSASPATAFPAPDPGTYEAPEEPEAGSAQDVVETPGGTVIAHCAGSTASVEPLDLAPGYRVLEPTRGPGVIRAGIVLGSPEREVRVNVRCRGGKPASTVHLG